jgi:hypothetical protein
MSGRPFQVEADTSDSILELAHKVAQQIGMPINQFDLLPRGTSRPLSQLNADSPIPAADRDLLVLQRRNRWLPAPNTTSITDPDQFRYHRRILGERLARHQRNHQRNREQRGLDNIAINKNLPSNIEGDIRRFLGGRKSRKAKKSRRSRTRKH